MRKPATSYHLSSANNQKTSSNITKQNMRKTISIIINVIRNNRTGFLVEPNYIDMLSNKILLLLNGENLAKQFGKNGRNLVINNFTSEVTVNKAEELFLNAVVTERV